MKKRSIQQEDIKIVNIYVPNIRPPKYLKQILTNIKGNTILIGDFSTPLTSMETSHRQKINKEILALNDTSNQTHLLDIYQALHPKAAEYTFFSSAHGIDHRIDHMLVHKTSFNKFKKIAVISSIFSDHSGIKLEINCKKKTKKT